MTERKATASWRGDLKSGEGEFSGQTDAVKGHVTFGSRFESGSGSNPEELLGAAEASCFTMALSQRIVDAGYQPEQIDAEAFVDLHQEQEGYKIGRIRLNARAKVPGLDEKTFRELATQASKESPVAQALTGLEIEIDETELT